MTQKYLTTTVPDSAQCGGCDNPRLHKQVGLQDSEIDSSNVSGLFQSLVTQPNLVFPYMAAVSSMELGFLYKHSPWEEVHICSGLGHW